MEKLIRKSHAKSRQEAMRVYENMEMKEEGRNNYNYAQTSELYSKFYAGLDPRRRTEMADAGMVKEDDNAMANLSPAVIHREYPRSGYYSNPFIDDSVEE